MRSGLTAMQSFVTEAVLRYNQRLYHNANRWLFSVRIIIYNTGNEFMASRKFDVGTRVVIDSSNSCRQRLASAQLHAYGSAHHGIVSFPRITRETGYLFNKYLCGTSKATCTYERGVLETRQSAVSMMWEINFEVSRRCRQSAEGSFT